MAPAKKPDATKQKAQSLNARPAKQAKHAKGVEDAKDVKGGRLLRTQIGGESQDKDHKDQPL